MELEQLRREYLQGGLSRKDLLLDPFAQFSRWMEQAIELGINDPTAMTIATVNREGQPSQRIVLLKNFDEKGFVFYTNYSSAKASDLDSNPHISLHFPWHGIDRQVKIIGEARKVTAAESLKYFLSRPKQSQLAAWSSNQSQVLSSKTLLLNQFEAMKQKFAVGVIPLPDFWGGYRVKPSQLEFWQGGAHRLHDRFNYSLQADGAWSIERLAP